MIIENTQQLDEFMGLLRRAAGGAMRGAARAVPKPQRRSASFAINRAKRRIRVAGGDLSKTLRGKQTGYPVNINPVNVANRKHRARVSRAADRLIAKRKAAGKTTTHRQAYNLYKKAGNTARMKQVKRAYVKAHTKRNLTRDMGSGSGNRARRRTHSVRVQKPRPPTKPYPLTSHERNPAPVRARGTIPTRVAASWNPTFDKLIKEISPPGFEGTVKAMKKHDDIDNPYALSWYMKKKGYQSHKNKDGTDKK